MALWKVTPTWKKSIIERQIWTKDGEYIVNELCWRWGSFTIYTEGDEPPEIDEDTDLLVLTEDWETDDCCSEEIDYDDLCEETDEQIREFLDENSVYELEDIGWEMESCEMYMQCDPEIERIE